MKTNSLIFLMFFLFNTFFLVSILAEDRELEIENGLLLLLHSDHTWSYKWTNSPTLSAEAVIQLDNGEIVQINTNNTWYYRENQSESEESYHEKSFLNTVYATGKAQGTDLLQTIRSARHQAREYLAKQLKASFSKEEYTLENLTNCIDTVGKDVQKQEKKRNDMWDITIKISLNGEQIQTIMNCAAP